VYVSHACYSGQLRRRILVFGRYYFEDLVDTFYERVYHATKSGISKYMHGYYFVRRKININNYNLVWVMHSNSHILACAGCTYSIWNRQAYHTYSKDRLDSFHERAYHATKLAISKYSIPIHGYYYHAQQIKWKPLFSINVTHIISPFFSNIRHTFSSHIFCTCKLHV
jgi:hypothetical protein